LGGKGRKQGVGEQTQWGGRKKENEPIKGALQLDNEQSEEKEPKKEKSAPIALHRGKKLETKCRKKKK